MRIGIFMGSGSIPPSLGRQVQQVVDAEQEGFDSFWFSQVFGTDALTVIALAGQQTSRIEIGTAVIPTFPRHPAILAQQALTAQVATNGRLTLGIGLSHRSTVEGWFGLSYDRPSLHMREYLTVLRSLIERGEVNFKGELFRVSGSLQLEEATPCPILLAALGPRMLTLAGELADGTITWMGGPRAIGTYVARHINAAAASAGRPAPRICVGMPIAVTDDVPAGRERAARLLERYSHLPSYRRMLEIEGVARPADVAVVGNEAGVEGQLRRLAEAGATDLLAMPFPVGEPAISLARTRALLQGMAGRFRPVPA